MTKREVKTCKLNPIQNIEWHQKSTEYGKKKHFLKIKKASRTKCLQNKQMQKIMTGLVL